MSGQIPLFPEYGGGAGFPTGVPVTINGSGEQRQWKQHGCAVDVNLSLAGNAIDQHAGFQFRYLFLRVRRKESRSRRTAFVRLGWPEGRTTVGAGEYAFDGNYSQTEQTTRVRRKIP